MGAEKAILGLATTGMALGTAGYAFKASKKPTMKKMIKSATGTIVGASLTGAVAGEVAKL